MKYLIFLYQFWHSFEEIIETRLIKSRSIELANHKYSGSSV